MDCSFITVKLRIERNKASSSCCIVWSSIQILVPSELLHKKKLCTYEVLLDQFHLNKPLTRLQTMSISISF
uniref:Uncharacterized protein n=1 Tax=Arundo donax TaxID=35708 RepID=A0A0A9DUS7_ARUDO